ncbi:hypothetical protein NQ318_022247 [Aromia moschata]|uniref:Uncharacterized protein n=1 Tax=Aromia moschata TaxID=1265417 RepID=A0AAV8XG83_9CUCU|nr:hypothetical protein NQ318_022247 [Aromia moschata]
MLCISVLVRCAQLKELLLLPKVCVKTQEPQLVTEHNNFVCRTSLRRIDYLLTSCNLLKRPRLDDLDLYELWIQQARALNCTELQSGQMKIQGVKLRVPMYSDGDTCVTSLEFQSGQMTHHLTTPRVPCSLLFKWSSHDLALLSVRHSKDENASVASAKLEEGTEISLGLLKIGSLDERTAKRFGRGPPADEWRCVTQSFVWIAGIWRCYCALTIDSARDAPAPFPPRIYGAAVAPSRDISESFRDNSRLPAEPPTDIMDRSKELELIYGR